MVDKLEERVEEIVDRKLGRFEPRNSGRRTDNEIRDKIQAELDKRPKTTHELSKAVKATKSTIKNHCQHLQKLGVVENFEKNDGKNYWRLNSQ
jgi:predicted ArsR family transcriptional regulator